MSDYQMYLNGKWEDGEGAYPVINPATEETIAEIPVATQSQVKEAFQVARMRATWKASLTWDWVATGISAMVSSVAGLITG